MKWLANELAALKGELQRLDEQMQQLHARRERVQHKLDALAQVGSMMDLPHLRDLMPAVRAHRAYGGRGFLSDWVQEVLKAAAPNALDMRALTALAAEHFAVELATPAARDAYRKNTVGREVRRLLALGLVERLHDPESPNGPGLWRWKPERPTLEAVAQTARAQEERQWH